MLIAVRHGPTALNDPSDERIRGWADVALTAAGHKVAQEAGASLKGLPLADLRASDMKRTLQTAQHIAKATGVKVQPVPALRPWDLGHFTGESVQKVQPRILHFYAHADEKVPGGESFKHFLSRFMPLVTPLIHDDKLHVIVSHFRNLKALEALAESGGRGVSARAMETETDIKPGGIMVLGPDYVPRIFNPGATKPAGGKGTPNG